MKKPKASSSSTSSSSTVNDNEDGISNPTVDQLTFAKALASPDKATRDKTINVLIKFFKKNNDVMTDIEMLKLWKALFYCYWLSDKVPIQQGTTTNTTTTNATTTTTTTTNTTTTITTTTTTTMTNTITIRISSSNNKYDY